MVALSGSLVSLSGSFIRLKSGSLIRLVLCFIGERYAREHAPNDSVAPLAIAAVLIHEQAPHAHPVEEGHLRLAPRDWVLDLGFMVWGSGFGVWGFRVRVSGFGCSVRLKERHVSLALVDRTRSYLTQCVH